MSWRTQRRNRGQTPGTVMISARRGALTGCFCRLRAARFEGRGWSGEANVKQPLLGRFGETEYRMQIRLAQLLCSLQRNRAFCSVRLCYTVIHGDIQVGTPTCPRLAEIDCENPALYARVLLQTDPHSRRTSRLERRRVHVCGQSLRKKSPCAC